MVRVCDVRVCTRAVFHILLQGDMWPKQDSVCMCLRDVFVCVCV